MAAMALVQESKPSRKPAAKIPKTSSRALPSKTPSMIRQGTDAAPPHLHRPAPETPPGESQNLSPLKSPNGDEQPSVDLSTMGPGGTRGFGVVESAFGTGEGPSFRRRVMPVYPRRARELGKEGTVLLRLSIDQKGNLLRVEVIEKAGFGFDEEALHAVGESTFRPATRGGRPVACNALLPIRFVLRSDPRD